MWHRTLADGSANVRFTHTNVLLVPHVGSDIMVTIGRSAVFCGMMLHC